MKETPEQFMEACRFAGQSIPLRLAHERKTMLKAEIELALGESKRRTESLQSHVATLERDNKGWEDECRLFQSQRDALKTVLVDLTHQIDISNPADEHGHNLKHNTAYIHALELLQQ